MSGNPPEVKSLLIGRLRLAIHTFAAAGDSLAMHSHPEGEAHITFVNAGRLRVFGPGWERVLHPGAQVKFEPNQLHAYEALEPGSRITNIIY
jgi:quercetin dioxygenase-like cupin family protein